jgi:ankyrin repeat protein
MDKELRSLLYQAVATADTGKVIKMIEQDRSLLNARLPGNLTPLMSALFVGHREFADHLIRMGAEIDIIAAVLMGDTDTVKKFLDARPALIRKHTPWGGYSLLHMGALFGDPALVALLLERGIDPNEARQPDRTAPLFFARKHPYGNAEVLLSRGADINARAKHGRTVLHWAAGIGDLEWIKFLLRHGADPNMQTKARQSPWMLAVKWKRPQAATLLVEFSRNGARGWK